MLELRLMKLVFAYKGQLRDKAQVFVTPADTSLSGEKMFPNVYPCVRPSVGYPVSEMQIPSNMSVSLNLCVSVILDHQVVLSS